MPVTGLRSRFFLTIMTVLLIVTAGAILLYSVFLRQERMSLIDQQVRETATVLLDSQLAEPRKIDFEEAEEIISDELGETRIGKFFIVRDLQGQTIFASNNAEILPLDEIPRDVTWFQMSAKGKFIRVLNLNLPRVPDRSLQVGLILDEDLIVPGYLSRTSLIFVTVALLLGLVVSWFLTSFLLRPIALLESFLTEVSLPSRNQLQLPNVPAHIAAAPSQASKDEFERMIAGLNGLIDRVNKNYQFSRLWAYQMAHELKTPLSLLGVEIERLPRKLGQPDMDLAGVFAEMHRMSETINSFLSWAELENSNQQRHLFVNRLGSVTQDVMDRLHSSRLNLDIDSDAVVVANPQHLEQLLLNLVQNALLHTDSDSQVDVRVRGHELVVEDRGNGIPKEVLGRLGEPFNRGESRASQTKGHGLGLAWIKSVCRLYLWDLVIDTHAAGTRVRISFPVESH